LGVREYWIVDPETGTLKVFRRTRGRSAERTIKPPQIYKTPLLPGFELSIEAVFKAAETGRMRG
jgi:Uma2 family endonuclease